MALNIEVKFQSPYTKLMTVLPRLVPDYTKTYQRDLKPEEISDREFIWKMEKTFPFDELLLSWNGKRPEMGKWTFWVSIWVGEWSPWIRYAEWGPRLQKTFKYAQQGSRVESYQDAVYPKEGLCTAFQIKVAAEEGADLKLFHSLYVCLSNLSNHSVFFPQETLPSILLPHFPRRSQLKLDHPRFLDLCSPTATSSAINYLLGSKRCDPVAFAEKVHDMEFDIYGNWILNTAEAFHEMGGKFSCHVERLPSFLSLHSSLVRGLPIVASVRGPLVGSYRPITFGHLLCVVGYESETQKVLCVDSGFPEDEQTFVSYPLKDFLEAWARRQNIAYLFLPKNLESVLAKWLH